MKKQAQSTQRGFTKFLGSALPKLSRGVLALSLLTAGACAPEGDEAPMAEQLVTRTAGRFLRSADPVPGQYIVVLKKTELGLAAANVTSAVRGLEQRHGLRAERTYEHALRGFVVRASEERARALAEDPDVEYVVEDGWVQATTTQTGATWGLDRLDQRELPLDSSYHYNTTASSVHAYVIDTGIRSTHSEFGGRVSLDYTAFSDSYGASDCNGHGTHVAGTIGGSTYGVAKGVNLHAVRVLNCSGSGTTSGVIGGVDWVTANHIAPAVANMSLGGGANTALDDAIESSIAAGVVYVVAAGNNNASACSYSPARATNAITVGATDSSDARASYSNYGSCVDMFAPGSSITSAYYSSDTATASLSGTSMASPHVAGAVALHLQHNPSDTPSQVADTLFDAASLDEVTNAGTDSNNRLLFTPWLAPSARLVSIRAGSGHYMVAENGGAGDVNINRTAIGPWEKFNLIDLNGGTLQSGDFINIQALDGEFLCAEGGGGADVTATRSAPGAWERFRIIRIGGPGTISSGDSIALQSDRGFYFVAEGGGGGALNANRPAIGAWETFTLLQ